MAAIFTLALHGVAWLTVIALRLLEVWELAIIYVAPLMNPKLSYAVGDFG